MGFQGFGLTYMYALSLKKIDNALKLNNYAPKVAQNRNFWFCCKEANATRKFLDFAVTFGCHICACQWMRDKTADFSVGQNSRFWKRDKIADFDNETKLPILKWDKIADSL